MTVNIDFLHDEYILNGLNLENRQVLDFIVDFRCVQFESLRLLGNLAHPLVFKDSHTTVPHLQGKLLQEALEITQDHVFINFKVHKRINIILALNHEQLDMAPHIHRL